MPRPQLSNFPEYFARYISRVDVDDLQEAVDRYGKQLEDFYTGLPDKRADYRYAPAKWTLKEILQHIVDTERILSYRLLCIARKDKTPLPSFDEDGYAAASQANHRNFDVIKKEFIAVRRSTDLLILSLDPLALSEQGTASNLPFTANAVGYMIFGHMMHHRHVIEEKYF